MTPEFQTLPRASTLASQIISELEAQILSNRLPPGAKLPPERELARQFGVSRTVVREAVTALCAKSWLEAAVGGGAVVRVPSTGHITQSVGLMLRAGDRHVPHAQVLEVRRMLEIEIAGFAALRRTAVDLARLETLLAQMSELVGTRDEEQLEALMKNDVSFHEALALSAHNPLFPILLEPIAEILLAVRRLGMRLPESHHHALKFHGAILQAVQAGDAEAARDAMRAHLVESEQTMRRAALELDGEEELG
jgi:GntR family transcriptional repressor for pyruvate dehydrogenase complex